MSKLHTFFILLVLLSCAIAVLGQDNTNDYPNELNPSTEMDQEYPNEMPGDTGDTGDTDDTDPNFPQASVLACKPTCPSAVPPADCKTFSGETGESTNLVVTSCLTFNSNNNQPYVFKYVNVLNNGIIWFVDDGNTVDFRANSILVEQGGRIVGGQWCKPFGCNGGKLKIGLWGTDPSEQDTVSADGQGITCLTEGGCYPAELTTSPHCCQNSPLTNPCSSTTDCEICNSGPSCTSFNQNAIFEGYGSLPHDSANNPFGFKVLAVSYGGSLELFGRKGVRPSDFVDPSKKSPAMCRTPSDSFNSSNWSVFSGYSWTRLGKTANVGDTTISLDRSVNWEKGDQIVVSTTDWHASHSELLTLNSAVNSKTYTASIASSFKFAHDGNYFVIDPVLSAQSKNPNKDINMKAAVGLLSRSITIYSLGADSKTNFPAASACTINSNNSPDCYFGGHTIVRQGFAKFQLQGVELKQLGQGGRMAHYPIHYHLCKRTYYTNTFVKDCSSWDSMNRFYTIHATQGVTLERNVGYLSVGHGYYLEDGSEVNNKLCYNLAVGIRAPLVTYLEAQAKLDSSSPTARKIPGILPYVNTKPQDKVLTTDILGGDDAMPVAFWTMGMWNDFVGNMAAGVSGYGSCFWLLGSSLSGRSRSLKWTKYSRTEEDYTQWGSVAGRVTPLKRFRDNSCSTAYAALQTAITVFPGTLDMTGFSKVPNTRDGVVPHPYKLPYDALPIVTQNYNPTKFSTSNAYLTSTTLCGRAVPFGGNALDTNVEVCSGPIIDRFRASFNWPEVNFGSVWLRGYWFALLNSFVTDQLFGGVGLVTGGNWQDIPPGYWMLIGNSTFVGPTQKSNVYANFTGPIFTRDQFNVQASAQMSFIDGTGFVPGDLNPSRPITIYDGPFFADGNNFIGITNFTCNPDPNNNDCGAYMFTLQPQDRSGVKSQFPRMNVMNAAVGWKQPNMFYYPPAFAFRRSAFDAKTMRHNVLDFTHPYVKSGFGLNPYIYPSMFNNARTIDATTILIDMDGTFTSVADPVTGRSSSISENTFFNAPTQTPECKSFGLQTTPSDMVTTVITGAQPAGNGIYSTNQAFSNSRAAFVPIFRQLVLPNDVVCDYNMCNGSLPQNPMFNCTTGTFMAGATAWTAPMLTADQMTYYIDTYPQPLNGPVCSLFNNNFLQTQLFKPKQSYALFQLFPQTTTKITYQIYVGKSFKVGVDGFFARTFTTTFVQSNQNQAIVPFAAYPSTLATLDSEGVLTVVLDNSYIAEHFAFEHTEDYGKCVPRDMCQVDSTGTKCVVSDLVTDPQLRASMSEACEFWASSASGVLPSNKRTLVDCPAEGCLAFYFTLPDDFSPRPYAEVGKRLVKPFGCEAPWNTSLVVDTSIPGNTCQGKASTCTATNPYTGTVPHRKLKVAVKSKNADLTLRDRFYASIGLSYKSNPNNSGSSLAPLSLTIVLLCIFTTLFNGARFLSFFSK